jgi:5-deoxy-glucuronate isomerase
MSGAVVTGFGKGFGPGYTPLTRAGEAERDTGMDLGVRRMGAGESAAESDPREAAWLLLGGEAELEWDGGQEVVRRRSLFDEPPAALHLPRNGRVAVRARADTEWLVVRTANERAFAPRLFRPGELRPEYRGSGLAQGACLRNVRLIFDDAVRPESNLVLGEVVNYAGRWSSYPPHTHPHPEIYHYRFSEPQGYGHAELDDDVYKVRNGDTLKITDGRSHAQVSAPGYAMYYVWVVRHLPGNRYRGFTYLREHEWVLDPAHQGWAPREGPRS